MVTHSVTMLEKHLVYTGESPPRNFTTNRVKKRSMKPEDPMSHRIIEKRRRDRMNNCLADLSRLIPPEYLKKGRGRIEKTEIIEMAIKHMRHLQSIIGSSRLHENSDNSVPSPPGVISRDIPSIAVDQPIIIEHYRLGYLECLSEAMHFLVEVQGYFAGDSLCVQMINHLHKHCDKILKGNPLSFPKKHTGETASSESSTSPANGTYNNSPPLGMSNSTGSVSDDNQSHPNYESGRQYEHLSTIYQNEHHSPRRYSDSSYTSSNPRKNSDGCYTKYEPEKVESENRSDSEIHQNYIIKCKTNEIQKDDTKTYLNNYETATNFVPRNYPVSNEVYIHTEDSGSFENISLKEENLNGPSQLREMLTSPSSINPQVNGHSNRNTTEMKGNTSPMSNTSGCESSSHLQGIKPSTPKSFGFKSQDGNDGNQEFSDGLPPDNHHMMYKFKNNIKQRFSKEKRENSESDINGEVLIKKAKHNEDYPKYPDPLMRDRLDLLDRTEADEEKIFKFNADFETKKRSRYGSESETQDGDISNRLSFGHKSSEKVKRWEESGPGFPYQNGGKLWALSPNPSVPFFNSQSPHGCKASGKRISEYSPVVSNSFNNLSITASESQPGIPIFALHAKGSFYIPLTLDQATLAPFLTVLGITKTDEAIEEKTVLHPVTISVNFQSPLVR